jgi:hypothetical protein
MKPGDLVRWKSEYIGEEDRDFYSENIGLIISLYVNPYGAVNDFGTKLFNVLLDGQLVGGFDYEMELVDGG